MAWAQAFVATQLIEVPIYWRSMPGRPAWQRLLVGLGASTITHPFVWLAILNLPGRYDVKLWAAEAGAWLVEAAWLRAFGVRRALLWSLVANGVSLGIGTIAREFGLL
jgi:hypothetical protein